MFYVINRDKSNMIWARIDLRVLLAECVAALGGAPGRVDSVLGVLCCRFNLVTGL